MFLDKEYYIYMCVCGWMDGCLYVYLLIYLFIYVCICVCIYVLIHLSI